MKIKIKKKSFFLLLVLLMTSISLYGCFAGIQKWREEVQLSDGRVIIIERERLLESGGGEIVSNPNGTKPKEHRLRFAHPDQPEKFIEWRGGKLYRGSWPEKPLLLDLEADHPVVFTSVGIGPARAMYSKYVFKDDIWREEKLPEMFPERTSNLFVAGSDIPAYVDLETKRKEYKRYSKDLKKIGPNILVIIN